MRTSLLIRFITVTVLSALSACSTIKEAFPDKEKDYQFTTEIPKLIIPADLANGNATLSPSTTTAHTQNTEASPATEPEAESKPEETESKAATSENSSSESSAASDTPADDQPVIDPKSITVELLESSNNINYLRMNVPFTNAWRIVSKGLSRKAIEVNERNQTDKTFTVQYDPEEKPVEDGTYMDELNFMLHGFQGNEKEYVLKLVETHQQTDIVILNDEQKPVSDEASLKLLRVLQKSIKANLAGK